MNKKSYVPIPAVAPAVAERYQAVVDVLSGETTVTSAAGRLNLSRPRFQTLLHRAMESMLEELESKPGGRPRTPEAERRLLEQVRQLEQENTRLRQRLETTDRVLEVASGLLRGKADRSRKTAKSPKRSGGPTEGG